MFQGFEALHAKAQLLETLKGTMLDVTREPILQWTIGKEISPQAILLHEHSIIKMRVTQSPCASDVAVMAPIFKPGGNTGIILSVTKSSFTSNDRWFNVTEELYRLQTLEKGPRECTSPLENFILDTSWIGSGDGTGVYLFFT
ncbi:cation channel sperm-associated protein subunit beta-like [Clupea harengus]|uniref:Cation channel sperm-associated protein subunit beta-like n=1 Tax=Clupea harengus TaxID=7950 RepID=A0A6P8GJ87_CLUHA|nr:cation channel sperm-associated protein subunit beta-like [Clupea harengus]